MDVKIIKDLPIKESAEIPEVKIGDLVEFRGMNAVVAIEPYGDTQTRCLLLNSEGLPIVSFRTNCKNLKPIVNSAWTNEYGIKLCKYYYQKYAPASMPQSLQ